MTTTESGSRQINDAPLERIWPSVFIVDTIPDPSFPPIRTHNLSTKWARVDGRRQRVGAAHVCLVDRSHRQAQADAAGGGAPGLANVVSINPNTGGQTLISTGGLLANTNGDSVDAAGDIFVSTFATARPSTPARIVEINPSTGAQSTVASGGSLDFASGELIFSRPAT